MWGTDGNFRLKGHSLASQSLKGHSLAERWKFLSVLNNYDGYFFLRTIYLFISCNKMHTVCRFCQIMSQVDRYAQFAVAYCCSRR